MHFESNISASSRFKVHSISTVSKNLKQLSLKSDQFKEYNTVKIYQDENKYDTAEGFILEEEPVGNGP